MVSSEGSPGLSSSLKVTNTLKIDWTKSSEENVDSLVVVIMMHNLSRSLTL